MCLIIMLEVTKTLSLENTVSEKPQWGVLNNIMNQSFEFIREKKNFFHTFIEQKTKERQNCFHFHLKVFKSF